MRHRRGSAAAKGYRSIVTSRIEGPPAGRAASTGAGAGAGGSASHPARIAPAPEVFPLEPGQRLDRLIPEWQELALADPDASYFQTPDWVLAWWQAGGRRAPTDIATWRDESGRLAALGVLSQVRAPLYRRSPIRISVWSNAGSGPAAADHTGWLSTPGLREAVLRWMVDRSGGKSLLLRNVAPGYSSFLRGLAVPLRVTPCPRLQLTGTGIDGYSSSLRSQIRRRARQLDRLGVTFEWRDRVGGADLDALYRLHSRRWERLNQRTNFSRGDLLHQKLLAERARYDGPCAGIALQGGAIVGIVYGFRWRDTFAYYQIGWDLAWKKYSLGTVLLHATIDMVRRRGATTFDFLRGSERFKYRFGAVDHTDTTWIIARGLGGAALRAAGTARRWLGAER